MSTQQELTAWAQAELAALRERRLQRLMAKRAAYQPSYACAAVPSARLIISPWFVDPADGLPTRVVRAADQ